MRETNFIRILLGSTTSNGAVCELANQWTPMPQPLVIDSGAAETAIRRDCCAKHKTRESTGSRQVLYYTTADGNTVENDREKTPFVSTEDASQQVHMNVQHEE